MKSNQLTKMLLAFWISAILLISGCARTEHKDLQSYIVKLREEADVKHRQMPQKVKQLVQMPIPTTYQAKALKSPFEVTTIKPGTQTAALNPLQMYPINMLRFVGTLIKNNRIYAYIQTPDGMLYPIKEGDLIGDRYGKVISVETHQISIREEESETGKPSMQHLITLQLKDQN